MRIISTDPNHAGVFAFGQVAVGIIAFGQAALGVVAIGQLARGVFCLGQGAIGVVAIGQGAVGLWHSTGMVAVGGQTGYGLVLHLVPQLVREKPPELPPETPIRALRDRSETSGWVSADLSDLQQFDVSAIQAKLQAAERQGMDRVHLKLRANVVPDSAGYRSGDAHVELVAEDAIAYRRSPKSYLAYGKPPGGKPGGATSIGMIVARSIVWVIVAIFVALIAWLPLIEAIAEG